METRASPRAPWVAAATTATIAPLAGGDVFEETIEFTVGGRPYRATRLYSYDRFQDVYRLAYTDDFTGHLNVFAGKPGDDGRIELSNAETGTAWKTTEGTVTERQILHDLAADGFGLDHGELLRRRHHLDHRRPLHLPAEESRCLMPGPEIRFHRRRQAEPRDHPPPTHRAGSARLAGPSPPPVAECAGRADAACSPGGGRTTGEPPR